MNLLRLQLAVSAITIGLAKAKTGKVDEGIRLIEHGLTSLRGLLADVETEQGRAA